MIWRLRACLPFWRDVLLAPPSVLSIIAHGYRLPFSSQPHAFVGRNAPSATVTYREFVSTELARLVAAGVVLRVSAQPPGVCGISVDDSRPKLRLIFNGIPLNVFLSVARFRYEGINEARDILTPDHSLVQFDFRSAYHHVRIWPGHVGWLGFYWEGQYYVFLALPFGLSSAPYTFTKITAPLMSFLRAHGIRCVLMLDDGLIALAQPQIHLVPWIRHVIACTGFTVAEEKSCWIPSCRTEAFLGYRFDLSTNQLGIKLKRIDHFISTLFAINLAFPVVRRVLAALLGRVISMSLVLGSVTRLRTRACYEVLAGVNGHWDSLTSLSDEARTELLFWRDFATTGHLWRSTPLWGAHVPADVVVSTDASDRGMGAVVGTLPWSEPLPPFLVDASSTARELMAACSVARLFASPLRGLRVEWRFDNQAAALIVRNGSRDPLCHELALGFVESLDAAGVTVLPVWVPRTLNAVADALSKEPDVLDYGLAGFAFARLCADFRVNPLVDLFAAPYNNKCRMFFSRVPCRGTSCVDAFLAHWPPCDLYAFPPVSMVSSLLRRLLAFPCHGAVVVILPVWPHQSWWPVLAPDGAHFRSEVCAWSRLHRSDFVFHPLHGPPFLSRTDWELRFLALCWRANGPSCARPFCLRLFRGLTCSCCAG